MTTHRPHPTLRHAVLRHATFFASALLAIASLPSASAQTGGDAVIYPETQGVLIDTYYKDFKSSNNPGLTAASAQNLFVTDGMNGIRTPIYGDASHPAHPSAGVVIASWYTPHVNAILLAKSVRPDLKVFASKKLDGQTSWPAWAENTNGVIAAQYAIMLADYIQYMNAQGIAIDYLGVDNERQYNEGNITPSRYKDIIDQLRGLAASRGFTMPGLIAPEDYGPNKNNWILNLTNNGWGDRFDIYGTHYYPNLRPASKLDADLALIGGRPFWFTEPHWPSVAGQDELAVAEQSICALWDGADRTMNGFMWWSYSRTGLRGNLMRAFSSPLIGARPIDLDDVDGRNIATLGRLQTRAFINGNTIAVYALNLSATTSYPTYGFNLHTGRFLGAATFTQWTDGSPAAGANGTATTVSPTLFRQTLPTRSLTAFSLNFVPPPVLSLPGDLTVEATSPAGADVTFSISGTSTDGAVTVQSTPASGSTFPLGATTVTVTGADIGGLITTGTFTVTVRDTTAPVIATPANLVAEATSAAGAAVAFTTSATDLVDGPVAVTASPASGSTFALGTTTVTLTATDAAGNTATRTFTITVRDTTAPTITNLTASPNVLWPPNHKLVSIALTATATDAVDPAPFVYVVNVTCNEPVNGPGDGNTSPDWLITGNLALQVRSERAGNRGDRIYTILVEALDTAGNRSTHTVTVTVPHNR